MAGDRRRTASPRVRFAVAAALAGALVAACVIGRDKADAAAGLAVASATIVADPARDSLWVSSPDDDAVVELDRGDLTVRRSLPVADEPLGVALVDDRLLVTRRLGTSVTVVDIAADPAASAEVPVPCGGTGSVVAASAEQLGTGAALAFVTCPSDGRVLVLDLDAGTVLAGLAVERPGAVALSGTRLTVTASTTGRILSWPIATVARTAASADSPTDLLGLEPQEAAVWVPDGRSASGLASLAATGEDEVVAGYQIVDNQRAPTAAERAAGGGSYGELVGGSARIAPAVWGPCGARFADFERADRTLSLPTAVAFDRERSLVWVVGQATGTVAVVRCDRGGRADPAVQSPVAAMFSVGAGARGIVLADDGRSAWVDVGFDHAIALLDLPDRLATGGEAPTGGQPLAPTAVVRREVGPVHLSPLAQEGRRLFHDATNRHLTPAGIVTCASCHPSAGDDGLTWRIATAEIPEKVRRTPTAWALDPDLKPLHWDGQLSTGEALVDQTVRELLGGDGLVIDPAAIVAYMAETPAPPGAPVADRTAVDRGRSLFESSTVGCSKCHTGGRGTDGAAHTVLSPSDDPAARVDPVVTPALTDVRGRAPYLHDGRAATLKDVLTTADGPHGNTTTLTPTQLEDLLTYLTTR